MAMILYDRYSALTEPLLLKIGITEELKCWNSAKNTAVWADGADCTITEAADKEVKASKWLQSGAW